MDGKKEENVIIGDEDGKVWAWDLVNVGVFIGIWCQSLTLVNIGHASGSQSSHSTRESDSMDRASFGQG